MKNENVVSVPLNILKQKFDLLKDAWFCDECIINSLEYIFVERLKAEKDVENKQIIPYALVFDKNGQVLYYQRNGSEKRLTGVYSVGIGGHINDSDNGKTLYERVVNGLQREINEEIGVHFDVGQMQLLGMINEDRTEIGLNHIGIVFKISIENQTISFSQEIGKPMWAYPYELDLEKFELWSTLAINLLK